MEYPVWWIPEYGGGLIIALVAVVHVFVAHFAVGGGLFLVVTEHWARRRKSDVALEYVRRHTLFFLLMTMVFGGLTGVGIWFVIQLLNPAATSTLIHYFVFGWATEWVFFLGEITALLIYYYYFKKMKARDHLVVGWLYFAFAWLSLFMINGIVGFMLTPGGWLETGNFWQGFFNPSFWPSLFFRSFLALTLAGLFGFLTASRVKEKAERRPLVRYTSLWVLIPFLGVMATGWWYVKALPAPQQEMILAKSTEIPAMLRAFLIVSPALFVGGLLMAIGLPKPLRTSLAVLLMILGFIQVGSFEWIREAGRRPYIIYGYTYSSNIPVDRLAEVNQNGLLASTGWTLNSEITDANLREAGQEIYGFQCLPCHSIGGPMLDIRQRTQGISVAGMEARLSGQGRLRPYMPPFAGTALERLALASYVVYDVNGQDVEPTPTAYEAPQLEFEIPPFDTDNDEYVLLAWNNLGMHCISDSDPYWILLPPANDLFAVLLKRGPVPQIITEGVTISYQVEQGFETPSAHVRFWEFAHKIFGLDAPLTLNEGLSGHGVSGEMEAEPDLGSWSANLVPVVPYSDTVPFNPFPLFTVQAHDASGQLLAESRMVAPTSTEMGCKNCHGGEWRVEGVAGFTDETSAGILEAHDRINGTTLLADAEGGQPRLCQSCHSDPVLGTPGEEGVLAFPAAIHGWHANYMTDMGTEACFMCHPASAAGPTGCLRGVHAERGLDCTSCHGFLEDHALSLLKKEAELGKATAPELMANLTPRSVASVDEVIGRTPWLMEPDCMSCHDHRELPSLDASSFNKWTSGELTDLYRLRKHEYMNILCESCHGSTHAVYPADNIYGADRDNIPPLQLQGVAAPIGDMGNCAVCHGMDMGGTSH